MRLCRTSARLTLCIPLAFSAALLAAPALADMPPGVSHFTLQNGMQAVVIEDHRAPVVVQMVWYKIGSADEQPGKSGIAHYLEHLMFKGTDTLAPGELSKTVTANGGMDNAFTSYDFTTYFQRIAADRLPLVMRMEADRMQNLKIGEDDWQAERQVVLEERAQRTDSDPAALFGEERAAVQFYNHPYGRPVIGWRNEMEALTRDDALAWYNAHYAPNDAVLVVAGDVTADEVKALAQQYYGSIPAKARRRAQAAPAGTRAAGGTAHADAGCARAAAGADPQRAGARTQPRRPEEGRRADGSGGPAGRIAADLGPGQGADAVGQGDLCRRAL